VADGRLLTITENAPTCSVFHLPIFKNSQEFKALLVSDMRKVKEDWANKQIEVPAMHGEQ
jgi:peroxiredoxin